MTAITEHTGYFDNFFEWNYFILKGSALWVPPENASKREKFFRIGYIVIALVLLIIYQPCESAVMIINPTLDRFLRSLRDQFNHFMCFFKMTRWYGYRRTILSLIETMQRTEYNYDNFEGLIDVEGIVLMYKKQCDRWVLTFLTFVNMICSTMFLSVMYLFIFKSDEQYIVDKNGREVYAQPLPVNLITPFENVTMLSFMLHFLFEIYCLDTHAWMIAALDGLFTSLMGCVSAHLEILQGAFSTIRVRCMRRLGMKYQEMLHDPPELELEMLKEMKKCIQHLNMLLDVTYKMEYIYNLQTCGQVLTSLGEMCLCLYFLTTAGSEEMGAELTYLVSTSFELMLYCWFGNAVTQASVVIPNAIYEGDWLSTGRSFKSCMLITMTRMKKPICMTIGKFTPLTYTTFLSIAKVSYSFFTVLKSDAIN